jgi:UDP-N-acetylmuramoyl-L-alanyl-D-glutamate--2,6-diaminopimelate ligase
MKEKIKKILPKSLISIYHFILAFLGALIYGFPSKKIILIGVTGTNGKTTTTEMIAEIFEKAGKKIALLNSIRFKIGEKEEINKLRMTMPGRFFIQRFLKKAKKEGCEYAIVEVTSEGIKQHRHRFLDFKVAVFTNLTPEHIEAHGSFEKYREAKLKLFEATKEIHVINIEDKNADYFLRTPAKNKITFGLEKGDFNLKNTDIKIQIPGEFNLYNALAAFSVAKTLGIEEKIIKEALREFKGVPGRMEEVISRPFKVIVDYAFTPNALEKVYQTLINLKPKTYNLKPKIICVLGACGGGRDKWKRPVLGEIAAKYCNEVIVTNEDPYDEDPWQIIEGVAKGTNGKARKILDRREAIKEALKLAKEGDIVVITGKGAEPSIVEKGKKIPWDDRKVVKEEFEKLFLT